MDAQTLNRTCACTTLDRAALAASFERTADDVECVAGLIETRPHLISSTPVFIAKTDAAAMFEIVDAAESAFRLPGFRDAAFARAPETARIDHGPRGAFMGYDFHIGDDGPKLIEINTNAGGAFLNAFIARAQRGCCASGGDPLAQRAAAFDDAVVKMFESEWRLQRGAGRPRRIAIVDDAPREQYLYPEFVLARRLLENHGFETVIVDAADLHYRGGALYAGGQALDLVYNRLVDFALSDPAHVALRDAYRDGAAVVTPNPANHALYADKRSLALLADRAQLERWGLGEAALHALRKIPHAVEVTHDNAGALWAARKDYFFKPVSGYGGKAVYRGDKLTKSVWETIQRGGYIAQQFAAPSARVVSVEGDVRACKADVRLYVYDGRPLLAAARLYQGQTTNFRTPGGGFAPVLIV